MKSYPSILGPNKSPRLDCIAFYKYDGSNLRFEYSRKRGWYKFGTRNRLFDEKDPEFGTAIGLFLKEYGESLPKTIKDNKHYRGIDEFVVFCEFFGPSSFAGWHNFTEQHEVVLFDINLHRKGFVLPRDFVKYFGNLKIPPVVYDGPFNNQFIMDVKNGKYDVIEGVVAKGLNNNKPPHNIWMSKVKTNAWLEKLKQKAELLRLDGILRENLSEQGAEWL